jgi:hypothetical protein
MQKTKSNAKIQNKSSNKKQKTNKTVLSQGGNYQKTSTAASYDVVLRNPTQFSISGKGLVHSEYGSALRVQGRQLLTNVATTAANNNVFSANGATLVSGNLIYISPNNLNDRVAAISALYQRYVFRSMKFVYVTRVATTQAGAFAMAYNTDAAFTVSSTANGESYATLQDIEPCIVLPFRQEKETLSASYSGERTFFVLYDSNATASAESIRQCVQGALVAFPDLTSIGAITMGEIYFEYVLDLYVPTLQQTNITFLSANVKESICSLRNKFLSLKSEERQKVSKSIIEFFLNLEKIL